MTPPAHIALPVLLLSLLPVLPADAKPVETTKYKYYAISGDNPGEIYMAMVRRGPDVNGVNAYASTLATSSQTGRLMQGKSCRIDGYQVRIDFVINLPRLKNEKALSGATKAKWGQFKSFLKSHEETHRSIWLGCARELEAKIAGIRNTNCKALDKEAARLFEKMRSACQKKHKAFDAAEQEKLLRHPFVKLVFGGRPRVAKAN
jgi:predicted secreted Zn-dependent protease